MSVNWYWKDKVGEVIFKDIKNNQKWKLEMYTGNIMCCFIYRFKDNGEKRYTFFTFFDDIKHAKKCLKDMRFEEIALGNHKVIKFKLCVTNPKLKHSNQEMMKLAKLLTEHKYKVELY